jgi:ABC-type transporter Mla maintaining outer membrane lipid asymmetry permease subunit MlaE
MHTAVPGMLYARALLWCHPVAALMGAVVGAIQFWQNVFWLRRFGGEEYIPRVIVLSALRSTGPEIATIATISAWIFLVHRGGSRTFDTGVPRSGALGVGALLSFPLASAGVALGGLMASLASSGGSACAYVEQVRAVIVWADAAHGLLVSTLLSALLAVCMPRLNAWFASRTKLIVKLVLAGIATHAASSVASLVVASVLPLE